MNLGLGSNQAGVLAIFRFHDSLNVWLDVNQMFSEAGRD